MVPCEFYIIGAALMAALAAFGVGYGRGYRYGHSSALKELLDEEHSDD